jgi:hypothetical protein
MRTIRIRIIGKVAVFTVCFRIHQFLAQVRPSHNYSAVLLLGVPQEELTPRASNFRLCHGGEGLKTRREDLVSPGMIATPPHVLHGRGERMLEEGFSRLARDYPGRVSVRIGTIPIVRRVGGLADIQLTTGSVSSPAFAARGPACGPSTA